MRPQAIQLQSPEATFEARASPRRRESSCFLWCRDCVQLVRACCSGELNATQYVRGLALRPHNRWTLFIALGAIVGFIDFCVANTMAIAVNFKFGLAMGAGVWQMTLTLVAICSIAAAASVAVVVYISVPCRKAKHPKLGLEASGSGLSPLVEFLNGVGTLGTEREAVRTGRALLRPRVVACKTFALILAVISGLVLGREGPAVHIGAGVGWLLAHFMFKSDNEVESNGCGDDDDASSHGVEGRGGNTVGGSSTTEGMGPDEGIQSVSDGLIDPSAKTSVSLEDDEEAPSMKRVDSYAMFKAGQNSPTRTGPRGAHSLSKDEPGLSPEVLEAAHEADLTHALVTAGGAAGFAAAFHAPAAAVLYMLEEVASPEKWKSKTTAQTFIAAALAVVVSSAMYNSVRGTNAAVAYESIIIYDEGTTLDQLKWRYGDIPYFFVVSILAGVFMGLVTKYGLAISVRRTRTSWRKPAHRRILEAAAVAAFTALIFSTLPLSSGCVRDSHLNDDADGDDGNEGHRKLTGSAERLFVRYECPKGHHNIMASLTLVGDENAITHLLARDSFERFPVWVLALFLLFYLPCFACTLGLELPAGTFLPSLVSGAALGRLVGEALNEGGFLNFAGSDVSSAGVYALLGMAAALGGFTRCTVAVVVVVAEVAGDLSLILPSMAAVAIARSTASLVIKEGYTHMLIRVKRTAGKMPTPPQVLLSGVTCVCGNKTMRDSNFCRRCGRDLRSAQTTTRTPNNSAPSTPLSAVEHANSI